MKQAALLCRIGFIGLVAGWLTAAAVAQDKPVVKPLELIGGDVALIFELHQPKPAWDAFRQGELFQRLTKHALYEEVLRSDGWKKWEETERTIAQVSGSPLSTQLLDLCGRELILAVYLSSNNIPEGVFIARAENPAAVTRALETWNKIEPQATTQTVTHRGQNYAVRKASGPKPSLLHHVTFGDVFVLSDHESRIKQIIELKQWKPSRSGSETTGPQRWLDNPVFPRTVSDPHNLPVAQLTLVPRAWDSVWQDAAKTDPGAAVLLRHWPKIQAVTAELRTAEGLQSDVRLHLDADKMEALWKAWSASTPNPGDFLSEIPPNSILAAAGGIHFTPLWEAARDLMSDADREGWQKGIRLARGFLGGRDPVTNVLPALFHDLGVYLVPIERTAGQIFPFDGVVECRFPPQEQTQGLHLALDQALSSGLAFLSVHVNDKHPNAEPATVRSEVADGKILRWLDTPFPIRVAYQVTPERLTVSRSEEVLRRHLSTAAQQTEKPAFADYRERWFPEAAQFVCLDLRRFREHRRERSDAASPVSKRLGDDLLWTWRREALDLFDVAYLATHFSADALTVRLGLATTEAGDAKE